MNIAMPAKIVSYDHTTQLASIQPLFKRTFADGTVLDLPIIPNVPVQFPRSAKAFIHMPLSEGDACFLLFSQRSLDTWKQSGNIVDPAEDRKFDLSDCIAIPGVSAFDQGFTPENGKDVFLVNDSGKMCITPQGKFALSNGSVELIDLLTQLIGILQSAQTNTSIGPQPFIGTTQSELSDILSDFEELKK